MDEKQKHSHYGHRQRMREKFIKDGNLSDYPAESILEMLLFYAIPRSDTQALAKSLIEQFGSLKGVFDAPLASLKSVNGVGENTAVLIKLVPSLIRAYLDDETKNITHILSTAHAVEFLKPKFAAASSELMLALCLNHSGRLIKCSRIAVGDADKAAIDINHLLLEVTSCNAASVIIAHNHPGGVCAPSYEDAVITEEISKAFRKININLLNHIIISGDSYFSFEASPKYKNLFNTKK